MKHLSSVFLFVLIGCSVLEEARDAQSKVSALSKDDSPRVERVKVDLSARTMREKVEFALTNRPVMAAARHEVESARLQLKALSSRAPLASDTPWTSPSVSLGGTYSAANSDRDFNDSLRTREGDFSSSLSLDLLVWDFGRYSSEAESIRNRVVAAEMALVKAGHDVFLEVVNAYFSLLEADALLDAALTNEVECALHLDLARRRLEAGEARELDVLRARLDLSRSREDVCAASNDTLTASAALLDALGLDAARGARESAAKRDESALSRVRRLFPATSSPAEELFMYARTNSPAMRISRSYLRSAIADVDAAIADLYPEVSVSASLSWLDPTWTFRYGASFVQSVFQGFRKTTAVESAVVAMRKAQSETLEAERELALQLKTACARRDTAVESCVRARESLKEARENLSLARSRYEIGEATRVDYSEALSSYSEALRSSVSSFYSSQRAEAAIFPLTGDYPVYDEGIVSIEGK